MGSSAITVHTGGKLPYRNPSTTQQKGGGEKEEIFWQKKRKGKKEVKAASASSRHAYGTGNRLGWNGAGGG